MKIEALYLLVSSIGETSHGIRKQNQGRVLLDGRLQLLTTAFSRGGAKHLRGSLRAEERSRMLRDTHRNAKSVPVNQPSAHGAYIRPRGLPAEARRQKLQRIRGSSPGDRRFPANELRSQASETPVRFHLYTEMPTDQIVI